MIELLKECLKKKNLNQIKVNEVSFDHYNGVSSKICRKGAASIPKEILNDKMDIAKLEIFGSEKIESESEGPYYTGVTYTYTNPVMKVFNQRGKEIKKYYLNTSGDLMNALNEFLKSSPSIPNETPQAPPSLNQDIITKQLETIIRVLELIEGHTRPPDWDRERQWTREVNDTIAAPVVTASTTGQASPKEEPR